MRSVQSCCFASCPYSPLSSRKWNRAFLRNNSPFSCFSRWNCCFRGNVFVFHSRFDHWSRLKGKVDIYSREVVLSLSFFYTDVFVSCGLFSIPPVSEVRLFCFQQEWLFLSSGHDWWSPWNLFVCLRWTISSSVVEGKIDWLFTRMILYIWLLSTKDDFQVIFCSLRWSVNGSVLKG